MDRAYEGDETRQLALDFGFIPRRLKGFRRIFSRFDKLDLVFIAFIYFALVTEAIR